MKIAYNPKTGAALTTAPANNDITFDLRGLNIFVRGEKFKGTDTTYSVFKKHTSAESGGYNGLVPVPSYTSTNIRFLREDGTWSIPTSLIYTLLTNQNLDDYLDEGKWYYASGDNSVTNKPSGVNGFELYVGRNASSYRYLKLITEDSIIWFRYHNASSWTPWVRWYTDANTDLKVLQSATTTANFRPLILGYNNSTDKSVLANDITNLVYTTTTIYAQPSTGSLWANKFVGKIDWSNIEGKPNSFTPSSHTHDKLQDWGDTRDVTTTPNDYNGIFKVQGIKTAGTTLGLTLALAGDYATIIGWRGWNDPTGGYAWEIASTDRDRLYVRSGDTTTWNNDWSAIAYTTDTYPTSQINKLTGYSKATSDSALSTSDSLNTALGKLEYKGDLGITAYNLVNAAYDGDGTIENLKEILKVLEGIKDTETIKGLLGKYLPLAGGTMSLGEGLKFHSDENYFGTNLDARIISLLDGNDTVCDGGLIIDERCTYNGTTTITELLRIRDAEFKWKGLDILHSGNSNIQNGVITINGVNITPLTAHQSLANYVTLNTDLEIIGIKTFAKQLKFTVSNDTAPFLVTSDTKVTNLNADYLDGYHSASFLRQVTVANNAENDFNTFESMTLTGRGDPTTGASLSNAPWTGYGPAGGYGVLTYLWSVYGTQMAWGYSSNRIYIRNKHYIGDAYAWSSTWDSLALISDIPTSLKNPNALTLQAGTFTAKTYDGSSAVTVNIPTHTSHLVNNSGFLTLHQSLANYVTLDTALTITGVKTFFTGPILTRDVTIILKLFDTSDYTTAISWYKGETSQGTYNPLIGQHNVGGDGTGSICILPYPTEIDPWKGTVGLFIRKDHVYIDSKELANTANGSAYFTTFSGGEITSSGNTLTQVNHSITIGGQTRTAGASTCNIINSLSVSTITSNATTNLTLGLTVNGVVSTNKTIPDLYAASIRVKDVRDETRLTTYWEVRTANFWFNLVGTPSPSWYSGITIKGWDDDYLTWELASGSTTSLNGNLYYRNGLSGAWLSWLRIMFASELPGLFTDFSNAGSLTTSISIGGTTKTLKIDADMLDGLHSSAFLKHRGSWYSQNDHSADDVPTGMYFAYPEHGVPESWGTLVTFAYLEEAYYNLQLHGTGNNNLYYRTRSYDMGQKPWKRLAVADELKDPASYYWADVPISATSSATTSPTFHSATATQFLSKWFGGVNTTNGGLFGDASMIIGSGYTGAIVYSYGDAPIWFHTGSKLRMLLDKSGNLGIGNDSPVHKLSVSGDIYTTTGFKKNGSSDSYVLLGGGGHKLASDFMLKTDELSNNLTTITKSLNVTQAWMDTGIKYTDLPTTGTYILQVTVHAPNDGIWDSYWSGVMTWYRGSTNATDANEILLHLASHALGNNNIYLRTLNTDGSDGRNLRLLISASKNLSATYTFTFKFKRVI